MLETLLINGALAVLLLATLFYAVKLNRRIGELRRSRAELDEAVRRFAVAAADADRTMARLAELTTGQGRALQEAVKKAGGLVSDLDFLMERADATADRLEQAIAVTRPKPAMPSAPANAVPAVRAAAPAGPAKKPAPPVEAELPEAERKLLKALAGLR